MMKETAVHSENEMAARAERRLALRAPGHFTIGYRKLSDLEHWQISPLKDFSRLGVRFISDERLEPDQPLELRLRLPRMVGPVDISSRVVWRRPAFSGVLEMSEVGVAFFNPDPELQHAIDALVQLHATHSST